MRFYENYEKSHRSDGGVRTAYVIPARACVWPVWWGSSWGRPGGSGLSLSLSCPWPLVAVFASGGGVCRGTLRERGHAGKCSPQRDLRYGVLRTAPIHTFSDISHKVQKCVKNSHLYTD